VVVGRLGELVDKRRAGDVVHPPPGLARGDPGPDQQVRLARARVADVRRERPTRSRAVVDSTGRGSDSPDTRRTWAPELFPTQPVLVEQLGERGGARPDLGAGDRGGLRRRGKDHAGPITTSRPRSPQMAPIRAACPAPRRARAAGSSPSFKAPVRASIRSEPGRKIARSASWRDAPARSSSPYFAPISSRRRSTRGWYASSNAVGGARDPGTLEHPIDRLLGGFGRRAASVARWPNEAPLDEGRSTLGACPAPDRERRASKRTARRR
jgi:hypothetical protein